MHRISKYTFGLLVISAILVASEFASAEVTLNYSGETPTNSGLPNAGISGYSGDNASGEFWDYVYDLSETAAYDGPFIWGIVTPYEPDHIFDPTAGDWTGSWDNEIVTGEYNGAFDDSDLEHHSGTVWEFNGDPSSGAVPSRGTFHFQSTYAPVPGSWVSRGRTPGDGTGTEWTNPEPASMALTGLALLGIGFWRRRKKTA